MDTAQVFDLIDKDGSGLLDEKEGMAALQCAMMAGALTEDEAMGAFMFIGEFAGDDDQVSFDELNKAVDAMENMSEEEIMEVITKAHMEMM